MDDILTRRTDGKYEEMLGEFWLVEYSEDPDTSFWQVEIFRQDVAQWRSSDYISLEEARLAAHEFYDQI